MKKVAIVFRSCRGGVKTFMDEVLFALHEQGDKRFEIHLIHDEKSYLSHPKLKNFSQKYIPNSNKIIWDYWHSFWHLKNCQFDYWIYPKNFIPLNHALFRGKKIVINQGLALSIAGNIREFGRLDWWYTRLMTPLTGKIADRVVAVSDSLQQELMTQVHILADKLVTIHEGVSTSFHLNEGEKRSQKFLLKKYKISSPYIFYCGTLGPRKNILRYLEAFAHLLDTIPHNFYIASELPSEESHITHYVKEHLAERVFFIGKVPHKDIPYLYAHADLYVYPSLYESFGLPILEAQAAGCPVLTSNKTGCPEVAGEGAAIIDPFSIEEMKESTLKILTDPKYNNHLITKGYENVQKFTWEKTAKKLLALLS